MSTDFKIRPQDVAAYIVFQFKGLEDTLQCYHFPELAQAINVLKYTFVQQTLDRDNNLTSQKQTPSARR